MAEPDFTGSWKLADSENFDKFLTAMGVGAIQKKVATSMTPSMVISRDGDTITMKTSIGPKTKTDIATLGKETDMEPPGGKKFKGVPNFEDGKLVARLKQVDGDKELTVIRELSEDGQLVQTMKVGDVTCKRIFKRQ